MKKIVLASNNKGKIREFSEILSPLGYEVISKAEAGIKDEPEENGSSFKENACIKARAFYDELKLPVIADDSGLVVDALGGEPGIYSARYGGEGLTDADRSELILEKMKGVPESERTARFVCVICYIDEEGREFYAQGTCEGKIAQKAAGSNGFGYDPIFDVKGKTMAELTDAEKNKISHRGAAAAELEKIIGLITI